MTKILQNYNEKQSTKTDFLQQNNLILLQLLQQYLENMNYYLARSLISFSKFGNILSGIMMNLFYKGFCHPDKDGEGEG